MHPMPKISKRYSAVAGKVEDRTYAPLDAVELVKANATAKFDETVEAHARLGIDPKYTDQQLRTTVALPHGTGQSVRIAVIARGEKVAEAKAAGADIVGAEDLMETILGGKIEFDRCIATPDLMPLVGRLGKVLGPRNLMPNPKVGTVTMDVKTAVEAAKGGEVQFKVEKAGVIHAGIGKVSFDGERSYDQDGPVPPERASSDEASAFGFSAIRFALQPGICPRQYHDAMMNNCVQ